MAKRWLRSFSQEASRVWKRSQHSPKLPAMAAAAQNHDIANPSERAKKYTKTALQLKQAKLLVAFGLPVLILALDYDRLIAERANNITGILPLQVLLVWSAVYLLIVVFGLALSMLTYCVERKFSLTSTSIGKWLLDFLKASGVVFIFLLIVLESIYASFALYPQLWWMFATVAIGITYAAMIYLAPSVILPLFFKSTPLEDGALRERITHVCALAHREAHEVEVLNIRKRTHKANAMVLGWGRAKRIYLTDTLMQKLTNAEIEAVLAHELGHTVHRDVTKRILLQATGFGLSLCVINWMCALQLPPRMDLSNPASVPAVYVCWLALNAYASILLVRVWRAQERAADRFAWNLTGDVEPFISAMQKLMEGNLIGYEKSDSWRYSHPAIPERIQTAREYAAKRAAPVSTEEALSVESEILR